MSFFSEPSWRWTCNKNIGQCDLWAKGQMVKRRSFRIVFWWGISWFVEMDFHRRFELLSLICSIGFSIYRFRFVSTMRVFIFCAPLIAPLQDGCPLFRWDFFEISNRILVRIFWLEKIVLNNLTWWLILTFEMEIPIEL